MNPALPAPYAAARDRANASARLVLWGIGLNALFAVLKFGGGIAGHSYALIADGIESLLDILSSSLVWAGFRVAARPPDAQHPFGHGRAEPLAAFAVVVFIFLTAGFVAWHAVHLIVTPHAGPHWLTLPLLAGIIGVKGWFALRTGGAGVRVRSTALGMEALHHAADALTSAAAFIGIAIAVAGGRGWESADDWAALFACIVVTFTGVGMLKKALGEMMDAAVPASVENEVRTIAAGVAGVGAVDKCRVRKSGLTYLVDIQIRVDGEMSVRTGHALAHEVKNALLTSPLGIADVSVHVEPTG